MRPVKAVGPPVSIRQVAEPIGDDPARILESNVIRVDHGTGATRAPQLALRAPIARAPPIAGISKQSERASALPEGDVIKATGRSEAQT